MSRLFAIYAVVPAVCLTSVTLPPNSYLSSACFGRGTCSFHNLTCGDSQRIAVGGGKYGFSELLFPCATLPVKNCATDHAWRCCSKQSESDCLLPYIDSHQTKVFEQCSGQRHCVYKSDRLEHGARCSSSSKAISSFSEMSYKCVAESDITEFCKSKTVVNQSVFAIFDHSKSKDLTLDRKCMCDVTSSPERASINVNISALDVRIEDSKNGSCSYFAIRNNTGRRIYNVSCTSNFERRTLLSFFPVLATTVTPFTVELALRHQNLPTFVWIAFEGNEDIVLTCRSPFSMEMSPPATDIVHVAVIAVPIAVVVFAAIAVLTGGCRRKRPIPSKNRTRVNQEVFPHVYQEIYEDKKTPPLSRKNKSQTSKYDSIILEDDLEQDDSNSFQSETKRNFPTVRALGAHYNHVGDGGFVNGMYDHLKHGRRHEPRPDAQYDSAISACKTIQTMHGKAGRDEGTEHPCGEYDHLNRSPTKQGQSSGQCDKVVTT